MTKRTLVCAAVAVVGLLAIPSLASADYQQVSTFAPNGEGATATSMAVNPSGVGGVEAGSVYVGGANRILRYSPTGQLKEAWGWKTIASGPDLPDQVNQIKVSATSGSYELAVQSASGVANFTKGSTVGTFRTEVGAFHVGDILFGSPNVPYGNGTGTIAAGSKTVSALKHEGGDLTVGETIVGPGIPSGTTIVAISEETPLLKQLTLSKAATESLVAAPLRYAAAISAIDSGTSGTIEISVPANGNTNNAGPRTTKDIDHLPATEITAPISTAAGAAELKAALVALPAFEAADLSVSGGPGDAEGTTPYQVTFEGAYTGSPVQIEPTAPKLAGGAPSSAVAISTTVGASTPGFQRCRIFVGDRCSLPYGGVNVEQAEGVGDFRGPEGIAVDPTTGYVYVLNKAGAEATHNMIEVFSADGSEVIARFGDAVDRPIAETPEDLHVSYHILGPESIAVDEAGKIYIGDGYIEGSPSRVMCLRPESPGDYHQYSYCGSSQDIHPGGYPTYIALDDAGHLFVGERELIQEFSLAEPAAAPLCGGAPKGHLTAMTTDPLTGEAFYFNEVASARAIYRLKPCDPQAGHFEEAQVRIQPLPKPDLIGALAFNPTRAWSPNRSPGALYGIDSSSYGGLGEGGYIFAPAEFHPPTVLAESVSDTRTASTVLHAEIDPHGYATHYVFQYLSEAEYQANPAGERFAGAAEAPLGGGQIGSAGVGQGSATLSGLAPDTGYRFRVVASSVCNETGQPCVTDGEAAGFATFPPAPPGLPDHRAYELVSPAHKLGGEVFPADSTVKSCYQECKPRPEIGVFPIQSAPDGEAVSYTGEPFNPAEGAVSDESYVSRRTESGWQTSSLIPTLPLGRETLAFDSTLQTSLLGDEGGDVPELQDTSEPSSLTPLLSQALTEPKFTYAGGSADFSRLFFEANGTLTGETPYAPAPSGVGRELYEWHNGELALVNVLPGNAAVAEGAKFASLFADTYAVSERGDRAYFEYEGNLYARIDGTETVLVSGPERSSPDPLGFRPDVFWRAGADGSRALFSSSEELTEDANTGLGQEVLLSATAGTFKLSFEGQSTGAAGTGNLTAGSTTVSGLSTTAGVFTAGEAISGTGIPAGATIASCSPSCGPAATSLTLSSSPTVTGTGVALRADLSFNAQTAAIQGALEALPTIGHGGVSVSPRNGNPTVVFAGSLAANDSTPLVADGSGLTGTVQLRSFRPGTDLYEWNEGTLVDLTPAGSGSFGFQGILGQSKDLSDIYFVDTAVLPATAGEQNENGEEPSAGEDNLYTYSEGHPRYIATLAASDESSAAEASYSGRFFAFTSTRSLTGYGNLGPCQKVSESKSNIVPCEEVFLYDTASGNLLCASCDPTGEAPIGQSTLRQIGVRRGKVSYPQPRYLTDEGRLFFDSANSLSPRDNNEGVEDVYEFEPYGAGPQGTCQRQEGCVFLISAGTESVDSNLLAVDETGKNVFFTTRDRLVPADKDELFDVYDAREGGGFPSETETQRAECQGESCQPSPNPPAEVTPGSSSFHGTGNLSEGSGAARPCPNGKHRVEQRGKARCLAKHNGRHKRHPGRAHHRANRDRRAHR
ncbi:MAG TPA: hypothetical protein VMH33_04605 [Solirubrobacterales bacterium]|nr:hypothetical protein [Solirubrobacterales bacterium]